MPKHSDIERAKSSLEQELRRLCDRQRDAPKLLPSLRELSSRHGLSKSLTQRVVRALCSEGLLYPVHGMGTFAGRRPTSSESVFLYLCLAGAQRDSIMRQGFEERMSALGAVCIALDVEEANRQFHAGCLPRVAGVWDPTFDEQRRVNMGPAFQVPVVGFLGRVDQTRGDAVAFDDLQGGRAATEHLIGLGVRAAVFLGVHSDDAPAGALDWSARRADGFTAAMAAVGLTDGARVLVPPRVLSQRRVLDPYDYFAMGAQMARTLGRLDPEHGVVAANDRVAYGFLWASVRDGLRAAATPPIVGFDSTACRAGTLLTTMTLPWHDLGRAAADLLFRRASAEEAFPSTVETVPMASITRMSSRPGWLAATPALFDLLQKATAEADLLLE